jgi:asparagine synthase (glutamine-hydrolysing)
MTTALFGREAPDYVHELLGPAAVDKHGLLDPRAAATLATRAFDRKGEMSGEREEMALVGALTLQALGQAYLVELPERIRQARDQLDGVAPNVLVDHTEAMTT